MQRQQPATIVGARVDRSFIAAQAHLSDWVPGTAQLRVLERDPSRQVVVDGTTYVGAVKVRAGEQTIWIPMQVCELIRTGQPEADELN